MKLKNFFIISVFILIIITISAVSASQENITSDGILNENSDKQIIESVDEDVIESAPNTEIQQSTESESKSASEAYFETSIDGATYLLSTQEVYVDIYTSKEFAKDFKIYIDDKKTNLKIDTVSDEFPLLILNFEKQGLKEGHHNITFKHDGNSQYSAISKTFKFELLVMQIYIPKNNWGDESNLLISPAFTDGTVTIMCDGKLFKKFKLTEEISDEGIQLKTANGVHNIEVTYEGKEGTFSKSGTYEYSYFGTSIENDDIIPWKTLELGIWGPETSKEKFTIKIGNKIYKYALKDGYVSIKMSKNHLKIGKNTITVSYPGDSKYPSYTKTITFTVIPNMIIPKTISTSASESVVLEMPKDMKVKYVIYHISNNGKYIFKKLKTGTAANKLIPLPKLSKGNHLIRITYTTENGVTFSDEEYITVYKNSNGFKSSISTKNTKVGNKITVKVKSPKLKTNAIVLVDEKKVKTASLKKGKASLKFSILTPGKHKITILVKKGKKFYSKVYYVKVKERATKLSLKTVKVKRSAKKLVLEATLKNNKGKLLAGKKITFKFNGKLYKAKTNSKGVAKVAIKKSALKKLKVGSKVTYKAKYQYTIEKTAKVKK